MFVRVLAVLGLSVALAIPVAQAETPLGAFKRDHANTSLNANPGNALRGGHNLTRQQRAKARRSVNRNVRRGQARATQRAKRTVAVERPALAPQTVAFAGFKPGTVVIDTRKRALFYVSSPVSATRYPVAVGREGLAFTGRATVGDMQEWPRWIPTKDMIAREPHKYKRYEDGMDGGPNNPLGARAIYLYQGNIDTRIRIHGTNAPNSVGTASSNGCFRMLNEHVIELYGKVRMGAEVVVL